MNYTNRILGCLWAAIFATTSFACPLQAGNKAAEKKKKSHSSSSDSSSASSKKKYDYVIVGAGSAGCILARKLSDNHKKSVFVITDGVNRNDDPTLLASFGDYPAIYEDLWVITSDPQYAETYNVRVFGPFQTTFYSEGTAWGGSASHNYFVAYRGTPDIYDSWAAASGNPQWSYNNMLPLMKALENYMPCGSFNTLQRGTGGPINITQNPSVTSDPLSIALDSATTVGFIDDYNDPTSVSSTGHLHVGYSGLQQFTRLGDPSCSPGVNRGGTRSWSANEFLDSSVVTTDGKGLNGRKLTIASNAHANKVLFKGTKAIGVQYAVEKDGNQEVHNVYGKEIILCAGSVQSPAILERSGIGDPAVLEPLGIDVLVANPNVGNNLINQYGTTVVVGIGPDAVANQALWNLAQNPLKPTFDTAYFYPDDDTRRVQIDLLPVPTQFGTIGICQTFILEPESVGSTHIVSRNPLVLPLIDLNMYSDGEWTTNGTDANKIVTAVNLIASGVGNANMFQPPGSLFQSPPGIVAADDRDLFNFLTTPDALQIEDHIISTTRMGTSIANGVVDGDLNVFGVSHLKVADIGVLPKEPNGNTCYAAYMVGLRCATILGAKVPPAL